MKKVEVCLFWIKITDEMISAQTSEKSIGTMKDQDQVYEVKFITSI